MDVSFDFNDAPVKNGRELNPRRNTRFLDGCCEPEQYRTVRLFVTPTMPRNEKGMNIEDLRLKYSLLLEILFFKCDIGFRQTIKIHFQTFICNLHFP